ncbi:glycosyltransferase family 4 protein [Candidatus Peregrinibacteria bacterium]|nr:glycosyltransferase family 4 protein [Candidatus Peregrinibacteria bacterium]
MSHQTFTIGIDCRMYSPNFTGIGRYVYELVQNLQKIDTQNHYVLFFNDPEYSEFEAANPNFKKVLVSSKYYSIQEQTRFLKFLNRYKLDLMHFTHFNSPILYRRPSIVTIHDLTLHFFPGKKMTKPWHRLAYRLTAGSSIRKAKRVIAVSRSTAKDLQEVMATPLKKVQIIYEGVGPEFHQIIDQNSLMATRQKYHLPGRFLLYTGNWRNHKNILGLIEAFRLLKINPVNADLQLVITGKKDNPYAEEILAAAGNLISTNQIILPGLVPDHELINLMNLTTVYVFPSFYEGFGLPPLEAMACGTPVACSNTSCLPEICGKNVLYFNPYHPTEIAQTVQALLSDDKLRQSLIESGLQYVKKFSWEKMAQETYQLYLDALQK